MEDNLQALGRKVFCLALPKPLSDHIVRFLVRKEYEVYTVEDESHLEVIIRDFPRSVIFLHAGGGEKLMERCREEAEKGDVQLRLLGDNPEAEKEKIIDLLERSRARGQRRYVRFGGRDNVNVAFSFRVGGSDYTGYVNDISSAGMSCAFEEETELTVRTEIDSITLTMREETITITGKIQLQRLTDDKKRLFVVMFDRKMPDNIRELIQDFIHSSLQAKMDLKLKSLPT